MDNKTIAIIGGGPAGLMAAERLARPGIEVHVYEAMPSLGRKFLRAGVGGLNITHSEPLDAFIARYSQPERLAPLIRAFGPAQVIEWLNELGFETFTGTSGRVFPVGMKSSPILRAWLKRLDEAGVAIHTNHRWTGIISGERKAYRDPLALNFDTPDGTKTIQPDAALLALGGGSWPKLGSTGGWIPILEA
ncbi:MAG: NAD(P)/FAD-dependent oxidoreductase, partial [Anaerolineales bacterium]